MDGGWLQYVGIFAATAVLSLLLTPLAIRVAFRRGVLDKPGGHKSHTSPVPYLGGLAIVTAFAAAVLVASWVDSSTSGTDELLKVLAIAVGLAVLGLLDDLRNLPPLLRLAAEIGAGWAVWELGVGVSFTGVGWLNAAVTIVWVVGITNAFNLLDNMDGLSAGLAAIAAASFFAIAAANDQFLVAGLALGVAGCAVGFLRHNFHPAKIYMGDAGALFFGFMISYLGLKLQLGTPESATFLVPLTVCSVAVLDTTLVTIVRLLNGRSPLTGGRDHVSHRLVKVGLPVPIAVALIYAGGASVGTVAFVVARVDLTSAWVLAGLVGVLLTGLGVLLARVPVYEGSSRTLYTISAEPPAT